LHACVQPSCAFCFGKKWGHFYLLHSREILILSAGEFWAREKHSVELCVCVFYFREIYVTSTNRCFSLARWNKVLSRYISPQLKLHCVVCCCCNNLYRGVWRWRKCSALLLTIILLLLGNFSHAPTRAMPVCIKCVAHKYIWPPKYCFSTSLRCQLL
jgi:hypothetical protein